MEFWPQQTRIINEDRIKQNKNQWKIQIAKGITEMLMQYVLALLAAKYSPRVEQGWIFVSVFFIDGYKTGKKEQIMQ